MITSEGEELKFWATDGESFNDIMVIYTVRRPYPFSLSWFSKQTVLSWHLFRVFSAYDIRLCHWVKSLCM